MRRRHPRPCGRRRGVSGRVAYNRRPSAGAWLTADSGALITAYVAVDQGREVFAVPGPIVKDILDEFDWPVTPPGTVPPR